MVEFQGSKKQGPGIQVMSYIPFTLPLTPSSLQNPAKKKKKFPGLERGLSKLSLGLPPSFRGWGVAQIGGGKIDQSGDP